MIGIQQQKMETISHIYFCIHIPRPAVQWLLVAKRVEGYTVSVRQIRLSKLFASGQAFHLVDGKSGKVLEVGASPWLIVI